MLDAVYKWIEENDVLVNSDKTYCLRIGKSELEEANYTTPGVEKIEQVESMRDLGVIFDSNGSFKTHIQKGKSRCHQTMAWLLRTFENRSIYFLRFLYKNYVQPLSDYCSQIWSPTRAQEIESLESINRSWTRRCPAIRGEHYWDRLRFMGLSSTQRRHDRYLAIYTWKMLEKKVANNGDVEAQ